MAEKLPITTTAERLLADIAHSLRKVAGRKPFAFTATDVIIPDDETKPPASKAVDAPVTPLATSSQEPEAPTPVAITEGKEPKEQKKRKLFGRNGSKAKKA